MKATIQGNKIIIEADLQTPTRSSTGKTLIVANSNGSAKTAATVDGKPVTVTFSAYIKP
jgi:hypothetical protein